MEFAQLSLSDEPAAFLLSQGLKADRRRSLEERARYIERTKPCGSLVMRGVLPLDYAPPMNDLLRRHFSLKGRLHDRAFQMLLGQLGFVRPKRPLGGRPLVRFVRFSTQPRQDRDASWTKVPLDVLCPPKTTVPKRGQAVRHKDALGIIRDDANEAIDLRAWWEPSDREHQFVYLDVWTGADP